MSTRRFCDYCDKPLSLEDAAPIVREYELPVISPELERLPPVKLQAHLVVYNSHLHPVVDICHRCQHLVLENGVQIATLQPEKITSLVSSVAADVPPPVQLYKEPDTTHLPVRPPAPPIAPIPPVPPVPPKSGRFDEHFDPVPPPPVFVPSTPPAT